MDKKTFALGFIIVLVFAWGIYLHFNTAYGELYEYSGAFPVPDNLENTADKCFVENIDAVSMMFTCKWIFSAPDIEEWFEKYTHPEGPVLPDCEFGYDETTEECLDEIIIDKIPSNFIPQVITPEQKYYEETLEVLKNKTIPTQDDLDTIALIESILECERATGSAFGITQEDSFVVPDLVIDTGFPIAGHIEGTSGKLQLRYQECIGQEKNFDTMFGPDRAPGDILGKEGYVGFIEIPHGERAITSGWETIPNQETYGPSVTAHDMFKEDQKAFEIMCSMDRVSDKYKKQQGCTIDKSVGLNLDGTCRDYTVYNHDKTRCLPEFAERVDGTGISINADPLYKRAQYKIDQGDQQLAELLMQQRLDTEAQARIVQESHQ